MIFFDRMVDYLRKLYGQCPRLSTIAFKYPNFMAITLFDLIDGRISLPLLRVIKLNQSHFLRDEKMMDSLVQYEKSLEPEVLRFIFNDEPMSVERFISIHQFSEKFVEATEPSERSLANYLNFLIAERDTIDTSCLFSYIDNNKEFEFGDEDLVSKFKNLQDFSNTPQSPPISESIFRTMLHTWTKLKEIWIYDPGEQIGQPMLELMPSYWPNLHTLMFGKKPENLKFIMKFRNLKALRFFFNLPREDTMLFMRNCRSLFYISFKNEPNKFSTFLAKKTFWKYAQHYKAFPKHYPKYFRESNKFVISQTRVDEEKNCYRRQFDSPEKLVNFYYDNDLFSNLKVSNKPGETIVKTFARFFSRSERKTWLSSKDSIPTTSLAAGYYPADRAFGTTAPRSSDLILWLFDKQCLLKNSRPVNQPNNWLTKRSRTCKIA